MTTNRKTSLIICTAFVFYCTSCGNNQKQDQENTKTDSTHTDKAATPGKDPRTMGGAKSADQIAIDKAVGYIDVSDNPVLGYWVGNFGPNLINLTLTFIDNNTIEGFSVCAGNYRPIKGTIQYKKANPHSVVMSEPGDDPYDGTFKFEIDTDKKEIKGTWTPFTAKGNQPKTYTLVKKEFKYNPFAGDYSKTSTEKLMEDDVANMEVEALTIMRNEIYARHGYSFKDKAMRKHFEAKEWYMPMGVDIRDRLTDTEVENIELIYRYEDYYEENYNEYGR